MELLNGRKIAKLSPVMERALVDFARIGAPVTNVPCGNGTYTALEARGLVYRRTDDLYALTVDGESVGRMLLAEDTQTEQAASGAEWTEGMKRALAHFAQISIPVRKLPCTDATYAALKALGLAYQRPDGMYSLTGRGVLAQVEMKARERAPRIADHDAESHSRRGDECRVCGGLVTDHVSVRLTDGVAVSIWQGTAYGQVPNEERIRAIAARQEAAPVASVAVVSASLNSAPAEPTAGRMHGQPRRKPSERRHAKWRKSKR